ncbi:MAG TPA: metal ABC transporter substrate-binding protein [Chloroflexota bacterium]|nr:metal ABC transporter substrate-binding protein [Chloroflexota bacterium]
MYARLVRLAIALALLGSAPLIGGLVTARPTSAQPAFTATATIGVFADFARQVGGARVEVFQLLGDGVDPHEYQMTPSDLVNVSRSQVFLYNGLGFEPFLNQVFQAMPPGITRVALAEGLPTLTVDGAPDPHLWLDPQLAQRYVERIRDAFSAQDPAGAAEYQANAARYLAELEALDRELEAQLADIPPAHRQLVTTHNAFAYFARRYGFAVIGAVLSSEAREPSPGELIALLQQIRSAGARALFVEPQFDSRQVAQLVEQTQLRVMPLYSDALPPDGSIRSYIDMMRANARNIAAALR